MIVSVRAIGMLTPVGLDAQATAAAVRAGLDRLRELDVYDRASEPVVTARLDDGEFTPLHHAVAALGTSSDHEVRLMRLAGPALQDAVAPFAYRGAWPVFVAAPEARVGVADPVPPDFLRRLSIQSSVPIDLAESRVIREGRAGGLHAIGAAVEALARGCVPVAVAGGVDTYNDLHLLRALIDGGRVQTSTPGDRMFPGEGAAFLVLTRGDSTGGLHTAGGTPLPSLGEIGGIGLGFEPGHMYSAEIYRGEGLSQAFAALFASLDGEGATGTWGAVRTVYTSWNGESFWAKEWGVAYVRHRERFADRLRIEHPADRFGDAGAAAGPLLVGLAVMALGRGYRKGPCLVFCSSDRGARGAAIVRGRP